MIITRGLGLTQRLLTRGYGLAIIVVIPVVLAPLSGLLVFTPGRPSLDHGIAVKSGQITWLGTSPPVLGTPISVRVDLPSLLLGGARQEALLQAAFTKVAQILPAAPEATTALEGVVRQALLLLAEAEPTLLMADVTSEALLLVDAKEDVLFARVEGIDLLLPETGPAGSLLPPPIAGVALLQPRAEEERYS